MKYRFMNEHRHQYAITTLCRVLQAARAGFYQWLHKPVSDREKENGRLLGLIRDSYEASTTLRLNTVGKFGRRPWRRAGAVSKILSTKKRCPLSWLIWRTVRNGC